MEDEGKVLCKNTLALAHDIISFKETRLVVGGSGDGEGEDTEDQPSWAGPALVTMVVISLPDDPSPGQRPTQSCFASATTSWALCAGPVHLFTYSGQGRTCPGCLCLPKAGEPGPRGHRRWPPLKAPLKAWLVQIILGETHSSSLPAAERRNTVCWVPQSFHLLCGDCSLMCPFHMWGNKLRPSHHLCQITVPERLLWDSHPSCVTVEPNSSQGTVYSLFSMIHRRGKGRE